MPGAPHCADMPHIFGLAEPTSEADRQIDALLQGYTYNFIATGDPNGRRLPPWPRVLPGSPAPLRIGDTARVDRNFKPAELAHWFAKWQAETGLSVQP